MQPDRAAPVDTHEAPAFQAPAQPLSLPWHRCAGVRLHPGLCHLRKLCLMYDPRWQPQPAQHPAAIRGPGTDFVSLSLSHSFHVASSSLTPHQRLPLCQNNPSPCKHLFTPTEGHSWRRCANKLVKLRAGKAERAVSELKSRVGQLIGSVQSRPRRGGVQAAAAGSCHQKVSSGTGPRLGKGAGGIQSWDRSCHSVVAGRRRRPFRLKDSRCSPVAGL